MSPLATWIATLFVIVALCIGVFLLNNFIDWVIEERRKKKTVQNLTRLRDWTSRDRDLPTLDLRTPKSQDYPRGDGRWH